MKTVNITKGVNLRLIEGDKFGFVTLSVIFRQPVDKNRATANALLSLMLLSGSSKYKNRRLIEIAFEELEGAVIDTSVVKKGNEHIIQIYSRFKREYTEKVFSILNDIIFKPIFNNEAVEKNILKNIILSQFNSKRQYAFNTFLQKLYADINGDGYIEETDAVDIHKEYKNTVENSIIEIMAVGGDEAQITELANKYMTFSPRLIKDIPIKKLKPIRTKYIEENDVIQSKLCVGIDCDFGCKGEEYAKLMIANDIFGAGASSKLFAEAREKESLCYYISSKLFRFSSLMTVEAGIDCSAMDKTIDIIKSAVNVMKTNKITNDEIELSKKSIINSYKSIDDKPDALMNFYLNQIMADDERDISSVIECINSVKDIDGVFDGFYVNTIYMLRGEQ